MTNDSGTHASLLLELRASDSHGAWERFVLQYAPMIYAWCQRWQLQDADAEDITQSLLMELYHNLRTFHYDRTKGRFRGWLKTVTWNTVCDFCRKRQRFSPSDSHVQEQIFNLPAQEDLTERLERLFDQELLDQAKQFVRQRVEPQTWTAFEMSEESTLSVPEIAARLDMKIATVYVARSKVKKMLQQEIETLTPDP